MKFILTCAACLLLFACSGPSDGESSLQFEDAWVRAMPPGSMMTAGFGKLINRSDSELQIAAYTSPQFGDVSLHQTVTENGVSRMQAVEGLSLPAGSDLELAPGGYHLMLMRPLQADAANVQLHIDLADGQRFSFELPVERR